RQRADERFSCRSFDLACADGSRLLRTGRSVQARAGSLGAPNSWVSLSIGYVVRGALCRIAQVAIGGVGACWGGSDAGSHLSRGERGKRVLGQAARGVSLRP